MVTYYGFMKLLSWRKTSFLQAQFIYKVRANIILFELLLIIFWHLVIVKIKRT